MCFMALSVEFMCFKAAPRRSCEWTCPALLTSEFVSVMVKRLQRCTKGARSLTDLVYPRVSFHSQHPEISHRDNCWCDGPMVSSRSPKSPQGRSSTIHCHNWLRTEEDPFTDFHLTPAGSLWPLQPGRDVQIPFQQPPTPPSQLSDSRLCWSWSIIMFNQHIDLGLGLSWQTETNSQNFTVDDSNSTKINNNNKSTLFCDRLII